MKEVYIDCTTVILSEVNTGIQRVERNIIKESIEIAKNRGVRLQPVCLYSKDSYIKIDLNSDCTPIKSYLYKIKLNLNEFWRIRRLIKSVFPSKDFTKWIDTNWLTWRKWFFLIPLLFFSLPSVLISFIYSSLKFNNKTWLPQPNHIFIIPGSLWWQSKDFLLFLKKIRDSGCTVLTIIYDIIPITNPSFFDHSIRANFIAQFPLICEFSDIFITISKSMKVCLEDYLTKSGNSLKITKIQYFKLGCELDLVNENTYIRKEIADIFSCELDKPYLCVGTVEPRKNHKFLLDAFDKLWTSDSHIKLCVIGRHGWLADELVDRIHQHPQFGKSLFWFKDLTDDELSYCYKHAHCLIFPSVVEGFGLPLVEALNYQCPVMASDIPVFREIGSEYCAYFSLSDINQLVKLIEEFESSGKLPGVTKDIKDFHWPNWKESTEEFWDVLEKSKILE